MDAHQVVIDTTTSTEVVKNLSDKLQAYYVFPTVANEISMLLQKGLKKGAYRHITDGQRLAAMLTEHIQVVNQDKHLRVWWFPESRPAFEGSMDMNPEWLEEYRLQARLDNYGLHKAERLPGNVGYLDIHVLHAAFISGETAVAAMNFLRGVHAMIIDLRQCRGGEPNMNALLSSYFFGEEPVQLSSLYLREDDSTHQYWTSPYVPSQRLDNIPLYVLTSQTTFSGGEAFAYDLKAYQRATLVGESTRGGAHPGMTYRLHEHFDVFIPNGRPTNPVTGSNWEGTGVTPDIAVPQEQAFAIAYRMALQSITKTLSEFSSAPYQTLLAEAQAALTALGNP